MPFQALCLVIHVTVIAVTAVTYCSGNCARISGCGCSLHYDTIVDITNTHPPSLPSSLSLVLALHKYDEIYLQFLLLQLGVYRDRDGRLVLSRGSLGANAAKIRDKAL